MTDMQRYEGPSIPRDQGSYVLATDAEAAIAAAYERGIDECEKNHKWFMSDADRAGLVEQGQRDMLAKCIAEVEGLQRTWSDASGIHLKGGEWNDALTTAVRLLKFLQEKP